MRILKEISASRRRLIFSYDILVLVALLIVVAVYIGSSLHELAVLEKYRVFVNSMWLGALGGLVISLKGVYDNACDPPWSNCYNLWHLGRPFSGAATGLISALIFLAINNPPPSRLVVYVVAFILGTQEARFFNFLSELAGIFVRVPSSMKPATLQMTSVTPAQGKAGTSVLIAGQAIGTNTVAKIGGFQLADQVVAADGNSVSGKVQKLGDGLTNKSVDITLINPGGVGAVLSDKFTYLGDA